MQRLVMLVGVMAIVADVAWANTYVPGQIRDGVYIRPHFVVVSERTASEIDDSTSHGLPEELAPDPALLDRPALGTGATPSES